MGTLAMGPGVSFFNFLINQKPLHKERIRMKPHHHFKPIAWGCLLATLAFGVSSAGAQDDSVTARKFVRNRPPLPERRIPKAPGAKYILTNVVLGSTYRDIDNVITYGPFKNNSNYALTIALHHTGEYDLRFSAGFVDGIQVDRQDEFSKFTVQPGSSYSWVVQNQHVISAWVVTDDPDVREVVVDLPKAEDLLNPTRKAGRYMGCLRTYVIDVEGARTYNGGGFYYEASGMSDRSNFSPGSDWEQLYGPTQNIPELGGFVIPGNSPKTPGTCKERDVTPPPAGQEQTG
jgi:hypothetical protein